MKNILTTYKLPLIVTLLPILSILYFYQDLPQEIAIHFDYNFVANNFVAKQWFLVFPLGLVLLEIVFLLTEQKVSQSKGLPLPFTVWIIPLLSLWVHSGTIQYALTGSVKLVSLTPYIIAVLFIIIGNYLPKIPLNKTTGIKFPTTLTSEENWYYTHRLAGKLWVGGGFLMILLPLTGLSFLWVFPVILLMVLIPIIYSYVLAQKK